MLIRALGLETYVQQAGQGPHLLLLHGWGASSQSFAGLAATLAAGYRVTAVDLPGFGFSQPPPAAWGSAEYRQHAAALLDALGIARAAVLGHSFGGRVALRLAAELPERVARLVLVAAAGLRSPRTAAGRLRVAATTLLRRLSDLPGLRRPGSRWLERWRQRVGSRDYREAGAMRPTLVRVVNEDLAPLLPRVTAPTLILWGDQDREVGQAAMQTMQAQIPGARLVVFPGAGHFPFADRPAEFADHLQAFLGQGEGW